MKKQHTNKQTQQKTHFHCTASLTRGVILFSNFSCQIFLAQRYFKKLVCTTTCVRDVRRVSISSDYKKQLLKTPAFKEPIIFGKRRKWFLRLIGSGSFIFFMLNIAAYLSKCHAGSLYGWFFCNLKKCNCLHVRYNEEELTIFFLLDLFLLRFFRRHESVTFVRTTFICIGIYLCAIKSNYTVS